MNWTSKIIFLFCFSLTACSGSKEDKDTAPDNFEIKGKIEEGGQKRIYLEAITPDGTIDVAQAETESDGLFLLKGHIPYLGIYQLRIGEDDYHSVALPLSPNEKIQLKANYDSFSILPVFSGASWTKPLNEYMKLFNDFATNQTKFVQSRGEEITESEMVDSYTKMRKPLDDFSIQQMTKDPGNPCNLLLITSLNPGLGFKHWNPENLKIYDAVQKGFNRKHPNSPMAQNMTDQYEQIKLGYEEFLAFEKTQNPGGVSPEIALPNPEGKVLKLSDLRGKYVLIDFWASWCGPCRKENPNVVRLYNQYKSKGFTVFSVSLDKEPTAWREAIFNDGLVWPYHVSDLKAWDTPLTQLYGFNSIPHTVLIDKEGKIIARNLRGESLEQKLKEIL